MLGALVAAAALAAPMSLPGDAEVASVRADRTTWIVGARPGPDSRAIARRHGAEPIGPRGTGGYAVPRRHAHAFARALGDDLVYAQPNTLARRAQVADDPLSVPPDSWRATVADPALTPPAVTPESPLIALVDSQLDPAHPEFTSGTIQTLDRFEVTDPHGTATASVAAAPANGTGIVGVWPGANALNVPLPLEITCRDSAEQIAEAIDRGAAVINMSYGAEELCYPEYVAIQFAVARGIVPVAAAGNEFAFGNPLEFPASLPHVVTVAAVGSDLRSTFFSSRSAAIDLSAPGEAIMTAVPPAAYERQSGTSFAAPMVAAALAWVRQARPELTADQVAQAVRLSARDLGRPGWQPDTGFGLLSVGAALAIEPMPPDPGEPNDDVIWVDGRAFERPDRPVRGRLSGLLDAFEDPADVYRVRVRPRARVKVRARSARGDDVALAAHGPRARSLRSRRVARSARRGRRTERIVLRNRTRRTRTYFVAVTIQPRARDLDAAYTLRVG